jgi:hypothetical protein
MPRIPTIPTPTAISPRRAGLAPVSHAVMIAVLTAVSGLALPSSAQPRSNDKGAPSTAPPAVQRPAEELPIQRITLYRSGVGSFERRGLVSDNAKIQLRFKTDQVNDILKSMVVLDLSKGQGRIDGISYGSKEPLNRRLASFAVDISGNPTVAGLLSALRGSEVTVALAEGLVTGTILGTQTMDEPSGKDTPPLKVDYLNLVTASGIRSIKLALANSIELKDKELNSELAKALAAVSEYRADRTKTVDVNLQGQGARDIVIAYVQEAPVWKTSYRLVLPDAPAKNDKNKKADAGSVPDRFTIQGWAIVENTTDEDWKDVTLSLVSGRPVSFRMDLYEPLYVFRPEIPVPTVPGVMPRQYAAGNDVEKAADVERDVLASRAAAPAQRRAMKDASEARGEAHAFAGAPMAPAAPAAAPVPALSAEDLQNYAAAAQANAKEMGEVFQYELDHPVTVERQRSAMLPILNSGIDGRRVSIFNPSDGGEHPMRGLEITNSTKLQLMPGPISVFDGGSYAGDAQIGHVPAGDKRLLAYAVDLEVNFQRDDNNTEHVRKVRIVRGVFEMTSQYQNTTSYTFTNKDKNRDRTLIVEQPRLPGWELAKPEKPYETTDALYRFELPLGAGGQNKIEVVQQHVDTRTLAVLQMNLQTLMLYSKQGQVSKEVIDAFKEASRLQADVGEAERKIADLEKQRGEISADQTRIRENMKTIDRASDLYGRYMKKLTDQETRVEQLADQLDKAHEAQKKAQDDLNAYISNLNVE